MNNTDNINNNSSKIFTKQFIMIMVINFFLFSGFQMLMPVLPVYIKSLGAPDSLIGWIAGLSTIASLTIRPFAGAALDIYGRRGVFFIGMIIIILVTPIYSIFPVVAVVLGIRFIHGFGWGISSTSSSTIASDVIPKKRFGEGMGFFSLSGSLAMAIAPSIGLNLFAYIGFYSVAIISTLLIIITFIIATRLEYKDVSHKTIENHLDKKDADIDADKEGINQGYTNKGETGNTILKPEKKKLNLFEKSAFYPAITVFLITFTYGGIVGFISIYASTLGIKNIGIYFAIYAVSLLISRPFFGKIIDKKGFSWAIYPGILFLFIGMQFLANASSLTSFIICGIFYGIGFGAAQSGLQTLAVINATNENRGAANATFFNGFDGGIGAGAVVSGIIASKIGYSSMYLVLSVSIIFAGIVYFGFTKKEKIK